MVALCGTHVAVATCYAQGSHDSDRGAARAEEQIAGFGP